MCVFACVCVCVRVCVAKEPYKQVPCAIFLQADQKWENFTFLVKFQDESAHALKNILPTLRMNHSQIKLRPCTWKKQKSLNFQGIFLLKNRNIFHTLRMDHSQIKSRPWRLRPYNLSLYNHNYYRLTSFAWMYISHIQILQ